MLWFAAMFAVVPLMRGGAQWRTWLALTGASVLAWLFPFVGAFIAIDAAAGALVSRRPAGLAQRAIALLFVGMLCFEVGFILSPGMNGDVVRSAGIALGWAQWLLLLTWGLHDFLGRTYRTDRDRRDAALARQSVR